MNCIQGWIGPQPYSTAHVTWILNAGQQITSLFPSALRHDQKDLRKRIGLPEK